MLGQAGFRNICTRLVSDSRTTPFRRVGNRNFPDAHSNRNNMRTVGASVLHPALVWQLAALSGAASSTMTQTQPFIKMMEQIYGTYSTGDKTWKPKKYKEGKGRYLWTDAFGVCNFITLYYETKDVKYLEQAELLVQEVHNTLGRSRDGSSRLGDATDEHPTLGGMRIGKPDPEGTSDGDGQYFHYLTKWMFALNIMSLATGNGTYNEWAVELAKAVHPRFVYNESSQRPRMFWKMSIDLSKPAVRSEGNLDPFDGYVTYRLLQAAHDAFSTDAAPVLEQEMGELQRIIDHKFAQYDSDDPLDLGEACWLAHWFPDEEWSQVVGNTSVESLEMLWNEGYFQQSERYRLAFREFGTTLGVQCNAGSKSAWADRVVQLNKFWHQRLYSRDSDITPVMYCASLNPGVFMHEHPVFNKSR